MQRPSLPSSTIPVLMCGDCASLMKDLPNDSIDMVLTSPPYDNMREYNGYSFNFPDIAYHLHRVIKPGGVIVWIVGDQTKDGSESGSSFRQALGFMSLGLNLHATMIYMKTGATHPSQNKYDHIFEYMFVLSKGEPATFNPLKDRLNVWHGEKWSKVRTRRTKSGDLKLQTWFTDEGDKYGKRFDVWQYFSGFDATEDQYAYLHPATFPYDLAQDHILSWSNEGDTILDPMCGSGTVGKAAIANNRKFIGMDISQDYLDNIAAKRIAIAQAQARLL
jgi:DNA modification methylase